jgi:hypothetical protein
MCIEMVCDVQKMKQNALKNAPKMGIKCKRSTRQNYLHNELVCTRHERQAIRVIELLGNVLQMGMLVGGR